MNFKIFALLALLAMLLGLTACGGEATPTPLPVATTDLAAITLVPYISSDARS